MYISMRKFPLLRSYSLHHLYPLLFSSSSSSSSLSNTKPPTQESIIYVLKKLEKKPPKALEFFNHAITSHSFKPNSSAFNLMLRIVGGQKDYTKDFWLLLKSMDSEGVAVDKDTYSTILSSFKRSKMNADVSAFKDFYARKAKESEEDGAFQSAIEVIRDVEEWGEAVEGKLRELKLCLSESFVVRLLREVRNCPQKALGFFRWAAAEDPDYKHGSVAYNAMARVLGREDTTKEFWGLVEEMKAENMHLDIDTYIKLSRWFVKSKMMEETVKLYEYMMDGPYKPAAQDCGILLRQISWSGNPDLDLVSRVVKKYEAAGHSLSKVVYDGIHRSLTSNGRFDEAEEIIKKMREAGFEPDNITYSQLVFGLCKAKRLNEACELLDKMQEEGCTPDLKTWTILIQGHCDSGEVDKALECLTKMIKNGCDADGDVLDIFVKNLCDQRKVDGAYTLVTEMVQRARSRPWQATYKYLIEELLREQKLEAALKTIGLMKSHKYPPFADPFPPYIARFGTVEDAKEFIKALTVKVYPKHTAYLHVFQSFVDEGRYAEAQDLLFSCPHHIRRHPEIAKFFESLKVESPHHIRKHPELQNCLGSLKVEKAA